MRATHGPAPSPQQLGGHAVRVLAGAALVLLASGIVQAAGLPQQRWQYVAMAGALLPQVLIDLLAARDTSRRARLRTSKCPVPLLGALAVGLGVLGLVAWFSGEPQASALAALTAAGGLTVAASPTSIRLAPRPVTG